MVSTGDTDISLHMVYSGEVKTQKYSKCQDLPNFEFSGVGYSQEVKTQNTLSVKICLILNWGGVFWGSQNSKYSKCQDLPNCQLSRGGGVNWGFLNQIFNHSS